MLYVFQVDTGQMLVFEMDVAISTVTTLKSKIQAVHGIPVDKQVLVVSGGEILEPSSKVVCKDRVTAGTDTNPIFLFNKLNIEGGGSVGMNNNPGGPGAQQQDSSSVAGGGGDNFTGTNNTITDLETLHRQIESSSSLPPTYVSVVTRTQLAQHVFDMGRDIIGRCELLIHHQHLQHQGWAAVMSHNDDIVSLFKTKLHNFVTAYEGFCGEFSNQHIDSFVDGLDSTLKTLDTIKLPDYVVSSSSSSSQQPQQGPAGACGSPLPQPTSPSPPSCSSSRSIVQWLSDYSSPTTAATNSSSTVSNLAGPGQQSTTSIHAHLNSLASFSRKTYDHLTSQNFLNSIQSEAATVIDKAVSPGMREIKGLEERLYGLDQLLQEAKHLVQEQNELTQAFHQNVSRASDLRDNSIFPDLCASHQQQLLVMYKNHTQLEDIRRRCARAKDELTINLNARLKWIVFVQNSLNTIGGKVSMFHESLRRLRINVSVLHQVHECEDQFNEFVTEVRRRTGVWRKLHAARQKILLFNEIARVENERRQEFRNKHAGHFLSQAFSELVEDKEVTTVGVPELVQYLGKRNRAEGDEGDEEDDDVMMEIEQEGDDEKTGHQQQRTSGNRRRMVVVESPLEIERRELAGRVKELENQVAMLNVRKDVVENQLLEWSKAIEVERERARNIQAELDCVRSSASDERLRSAKLSNQVEDLKRLIDEFRVKEEENIRVHGQEITDYQAKLTDMEEKCNERVVELTRMLEFDCAQKIKGVEEAHKLEFEAIKSRFKLVNKSVFGGSCEKISNTGGPLLSPTSSGGGATSVSPSTAKRPNSLRTTSFPDRSELSRTYHHHGHGAIVFSDDDDSGDQHRGTGPLHHHSNQDMMDEEEEEEEDEEAELSRSANHPASDRDNNGSLERAVDAAAALFDEDTIMVGSSGGVGGEPTSGGSVVRSASGEVVVSDRVVSIATRLHNLSRVSIRTCRVGGDANLFYWNERFNAFTVYLDNHNRNVHFLNTGERVGTVGSGTTTNAPVSSSSSSSSSGLLTRHHHNHQPSHHREDGNQDHNLLGSLPKSKLFIAHITDKEFCVARRPQNRYNVPQGFHFYRVKCKVVELLDEQ